MEETKLSLPEETGQPPQLTSFLPPLPRLHGAWQGAAGNSTWDFDLNTLRWDIYNGGRASWQAVIQHCPYPNADHVDFSWNYPDFDDYLVAVVDNTTGATLNADYHFPAGQGLTINRLYNFRQADGWVAAAMNATAGDIAYYRRDNKFTWHEVEDCQRMILVPRVIHGNVPHGGGIEVLRRGPIGEEKPLPLVERVINGQRMFCGGGLCRGRLSLPMQGSLREVEVLFYYNDGQGDQPTDAQIRRFDDLQQHWNEVSQSIWQTLQNYTDEEWGEEYGPGCGGSAVFFAMVIFPTDLQNGGTDIGLLFNNFVGDPEHGLGVRIQEDAGNSLIPGPGDVAL